MSPTHATTSRTEILWLIKGLGPGGAERLLVTQARFGDHETFHYSVAYLVPQKDHLVPELAEYGVGASCLGSGRNGDPRWVLRLWWHLWRGRFDVVHAHSPVPGAAVRVLARLLPKKRRPQLLYTEHNEWGKHRRPTRWLNRVTMPMAGTVIAVSKGVASSMSGIDDVEVVYHGIDVDAVRATADRSGVRAELGIPDDAHVVGTVANLRWEKGYDILLRAARRLLVEGGSARDTWFVSVGQGPLEAELQTLHDDLGLGDRFRFLGYRDDATRIMSTFDLFVLASRHEGLPVALMEAVALGVPIVATAVGGVGELVPERCLVGSGDVAGLAAALVRSIEHAPGEASTLQSVDGRIFVRTVEDMQTTIARVVGR